MGLLTPSSTNVNFGSIATGGITTQTVSVTNTGTAPVNLGQAAISGTGFSFVGGGPTGSIAVGQSSPVQVQFAPQSTGAANGSISIASNALNSPLTLSLAGTATQGALTVSPASINFGNVTVGQNNSHAVTLTNTGSSSVTITVANAIGTGYSISGLSAGQVIAAGQSVIFTATFGPTASGASAGSIAITTNLSGTPATIGLSGTGTQSIATATPGSASFGNVAVGTSNSQSITLMNSGNATLTIQQVSVTGAGVSVSGVSTSTTVAAGSSASFSVIFKPTSAGAVQGSIVLTTNASPSQLTIAVSGTGVAATTKLTSNPTSLAFGTVTVNSSSSLTSILTNTGNTNVTISNVTVSGTGLSATGLSIGMVLQPNQSANLVVTYAPTAVGSLSAASVTVSSNASPVTIGVSGTSAQHSVSLNWSPSSTQNITGYYVYRSTTSGTGFGKLNPSNPVSASITQYADATVQAGQTYYYVVTAVNSSNVESSDSNQTTVTVP